MSRLKAKFETKSNIVMGSFELHQVVYNRKVAMLSQLKDCKWLLIPLQRCFSLFDSNGLLELVFDCFIFVE